MKEMIDNHLKESARVIEAMVETCRNEIQAASELIIESIKRGGKVMWCGNGGSAAQAQHLSTEIIGGLRRHDLPPQPSVSLTTDSSFVKSVLAHNPAISPFIGTNTNLSLYLSY